MPVELLQDMAGFGPAVDRLLDNDMDVGVLRPWKGRDGRSYITRTVNGKPRVQVTNTPATLSYDSWKLFDDIVQRAVHTQLRGIADIRAAGLEYRLPNGMAHTMILSQSVGTMTPATLSMDPVRRSDMDRPTGDTITMPLPIAHKDFDFSARELMASRLGMLPLDTTAAEEAAYMVALEIEKLLAGTTGSYSYGGGTIYGYTNAPFRATKTDMTVPDGTNSPDVFADILALRQALIDSGHNGPFMAYFNSQWATVLESDFSTTKGDGTLRDRILQVVDIQDAQIMSTLPSTKWDVVLVEMQSRTVRAVVGVEPQMIQWETMGGMQKHYKVLALVLAQLRADANGTSGVAHGTTTV